MSFFEELKRRNVVRVGIAYVVIGWVLAQVAEFAVDNFGAPDWVLKIFVVFLLLGLPLALFFAWAFEMTPEGIKREKDVDRSKSVTRQTGRKLNSIIVGVLMLAVGLLLVDKFYFSAPGDPEEVIATTGSQSIAVLPFVNMSEDNDHFADGLSEELLNLLAKMPDLKVAGRTSSFEFKGRNDDLREIGDALGVKHVLEGSVRRSGDRLRITAQLIKVDDGFHVWSETYDRQMADIFDIQDDVAGAITDALKLRLTATSDRRTGNPEAYALYLESMALLDTDDGNHRPAIELLNRAIALDPEFAKAYEAKALAYWNVSGWTMAANEAQVLVYEAANRALELDPTLVIANSFRKTAHPEAWSYIGEFTGVEAALTAEPDNPQIIGTFAYDLLTAGYFSESRDLALRQLEIDPLSFNAYANLYKAYTALGERELVESILNRMTEIGFDEIVSTLRIIDHVVAGDLDKAIDAVELEPGRFGTLPANFRQFVESAVDPETGREFLIEWVDAEVAKAENFLEQTRPVEWLMYFGYMDDFWDWIYKLDPPASGAWSNAENLENMAVARRQLGFARHPRYLEYQSKYGMTDLWDMRGPPDFCSKDSGEWVCE